MPPSSKDSKGETGTADGTEAAIAVHWKEESYYEPNPKFITQANLKDPKIFENFELAHFPEY